MHVTKTSLKRIFAEKDMYCTLLSTYRAFIDAPFMISGEYMYFKTRTWDTLTGKLCRNFQNRERCSFAWEKMKRAIKKPQKCASFAPKFRPFIGACSLQRPRFASCFADIQRIKTSSSFCFWKWKTSRKLELDCMEYFFRLHYRWRKLKRAGKTVAEEEKQNKTY